MCTYPVCICNTSRINAYCKYCTSFVNTLPQCIRLFPKSKPQAAAVGATSVTNNQDNLTGYFAL